MSLIGYVLVGIALVIAFGAGVLWEMGNSLTRYNRMRDELDEHIAHTNTMLADMARAIEEHHR